MSTARFDPDLSSAEEARRFVEHELRAEDVGEEAVFNAQLVVTELVTNAARHARSLVEVTVERRGGHIHIEARDASTAAPAPPSDDAPTRHRGLLLVEDVCQDWGVDVRGRAGKVVWCKLRVTPDEAR